MRCAEQPQCNVVPSDADVHGNNLEFRDSDDTIREWPPDLVAINQSALL